MAISGVHSWALAVVQMVTWKGFLTKMVDF